MNAQEIFGAVVLVGICWAPVFVLLYHEWTRNWRRRRPTLGNRRDLQDPEDPCAEDLERWEWQGYGCGERPPDER